MRKLYRSYPDYSEYQRIKWLLKYRRKHPSQRHLRESTSSLEARLSELQALFPSRVKPKVSPEVRRRNLLISEANNMRGEQRKQAQKEKADFLRAWEKKWSFLLRKPRASRVRRNEKIRHSMAVHDSALTRQIEIIHDGPCICFWCGKRLENGGTVDHIISLAKGGTHTSDNICAACGPCNSLKRDLSPEEVGFTPSLL